MNKVIFSILLLVLFTAIPAYSEELVVVTIREDASSAVIRDNETGAQWVVSAGDRIGAWSVHEITKAGVSLIRMESDGSAIGTVLDAPAVRVKPLETP